MMEGLAAARAATCTGVSILVSRQRGLLAAVASAAVLAALGAVHMVTAQSSERTLSIYNIHTRETVTTTYKKGGKFIDSGLEKLSHVMRDHRRDEATKMDPELIDLLWEVHHELDSKEPIHLISGYRSRASNDMLRKTVGGQASESRHILGKAADVHFPDVPIKNLRYSGLIHEKGGVGYYPTSAIPFVHLDTDRVRSWPRLPRYELALLFPHGSTQHQPADGGPISKEDVRVAQARYGELSQQIATFHDSRKIGMKPGIALASATPPPAAGVNSAADRGEPARRQMAALPPPVAQPARLPQLMAPSDSDRARLADLAALASIEPKLVAAPQLAKRPQPSAAQPAMASLTGNSLPLPGVLQVSLPPPSKVAAIAPTALPEATPTLTDHRHGMAGWSVAPAFDEEHPDELSYRPFPIAPFLTQTANEPLMADFVAHDIAKTVDMIDQQTLVPPLKFRPGQQIAHLMWSQQFTGEAIGIGKLRADDDLPSTTGLQRRTVKTSQK